MTLNPTTSPVEISAYPQYVHNCNRGPCEVSYAAPLPSIPLLQLYADFGTYKPVIVQVYVQDTCLNVVPEQIMASNYVVGQTPEGNWYGVFKYFNTPVQPLTNFIVWMSVMLDTPAGLVEKTFFSEQLQIEVCHPLTKIKACQPETATTTGFDVNGLYYGLPVNVDYLGIPEVRYFHIAYVRQVKVRQLPPKATFTASLTRNFRTIVEKNWILETELVPSWYKDVLLAIYARGVIEVAGTQYLVSDLAFEGIADDDLTWKPYANLKETLRLYFGCDESVCSECCSPVVLDAFTVFTPESPSDESPGDESPQPPCESLLEWDFTEEGGIGGQGALSISVNGSGGIFTSTNDSGSFPVLEGDEIVCTVSGQSGTTRDVAVAGDHTDSDTSTSGNASITFTVTGCDNNYFVTGSVIIT
jgi:hypothetical protein